MGEDLVRSPCHTWWRTSWRRFSLCFKATFKTETCSNQSISPCHRSWRNREGSFLRAQVMDEIVKVPLSPVPRTWRKSPRRSIFTDHGQNREGCSRGCGHVQPFVGVHVEPRLPVVCSLQFARERLRCPCGTLVFPRLLVATREACHLSCYMVMLRVCRQKWCSSCLFCFSDVMCHPAP